MNQHEPTIYVAIAEDHHIVRDGIASLINGMDEGIKVFITAEDGADLLAKIAKASHQPDVCLIDIRMPQMDGYETVLQIKKKYRYIQCLALTMFNKSEDAILRMFHNGAQGYITKNCDPKELVKAIREVYNDRFYFCEDVLKMFPKISKDSLKDHLQDMLTPVELALLKYCCTSMTSREIGDKMNLSAKTVENNYQKLYHRLDIHSKQLLALYAAYSGIGTFEYNLEHASNSFI